MDEVEALLAAAQGQLNSSLGNRDYGAALRSLERLKAAILGAEDVSASEAEYDDAQISTSDWSETDQEARQSVVLQPVASLTVRATAVEAETALVVSQSNADVDFMSDAASLRKVLSLASGSSHASIALHRIGGALVLDAGIDDDCWGDVDPETGEVIVCAAQKRIQNNNSPRGPLLLEDGGRLVEEEKPAEDYMRVQRYAMDGLELLLGSDTVVYGRADSSTKIGVHDVIEGTTITEARALDMWLANTIGGCDECAVCYHRDGQTSGYQLLKTEALPAFCGGDSGVALATMARARSILEFVKNNCVDDAATYCLTRGKNETLELWRVEEGRHTTPFGRACALLCLRIARRISGDVLRRRRLLDRCVALADPKRDACVVAEAHLLVARTYATEAVEVLCEKPAWRVAAPDAKHHDQEFAPVEAGDEEACLKRVSAGLAVLRRAQRRKASSDKALEKALRACGASARLALAARAFRGGRPGLVLRHLALAGALDPPTATSAAFRLRLARAYALGAAVVTPESLSAHRADLAGAPAKARARDPDESSPERRRWPTHRPPAKLRGDLPVDVGPDAETNLSRAVKCLLAALRGDDDGRCDEVEALSLAACLRIAYTALGEHYLAVARVTKAARHLEQGVALFRGLGDNQTAAWLRGRLAFAQATVAARDGGPSPRKHLKARAAVERLSEALQAFAETVRDEDDGAATPFPGVATIGAGRALTEAKRGAAHAALALAVMAPPQDAQAALVTAAALAADANDSETAADAHYRLASGGSADALPHLMRATAFADAAAGESQSRARAVDALSTRCDLATVLLRDASPEAAAQAVRAVLGAEATLALALSLPESVGRDRATAGALPLVARALLAKLAESLKRCCRAAGDGAALKRAYGAALRLGADLAAGDEPRLRGLLHDLAAELATVLM